MVLACSCLSWTPLLLLPEKRPRDFPPSRESVPAGRLISTRPTSITPTPIAVMTKKIFITLSALAITGAAYAGVRCIFCKGSGFQAGTNFTCTFCDGKGWR